MSAGPRRPIRRPSRRRTSPSSWPSPKPVAGRCGCASTTAPVRDEPAAATSSRTGWSPCATGGTSSPSTSTATTGGRSASTASARRRRRASATPSATRPTPRRSSPKASPCAPTRLQARVRLPVPPAVAAREIAPTIGVIEDRADADSTVVAIGGDADWIARFLAGLPFPFEILDSAEVRREVELLARRLLGEPAPLTTRRRSVSALQATTAPEHRQRAAGRHHDHDGGRFVGGEAQRRGVPGAAVRGDVPARALRGPEVDADGRHPAARHRRARPGRTGTGR